MTKLFLFAAFLVCSVQSFAQCSHSLFNTIANLEGRNPHEMTKKEFRVLAAKYANMVGEQYDKSEFNAVIARKLCAMFEQKNSVGQCLDLQTSTPNNLNADTIQSYFIDTLPTFAGPLPFDSVQTLQADTLTNSLDIETPQKVCNYVPIPIVLKQLRKEGLSPKQARCEVKARIEQNNGKKYDYKANKEIQAKGMDKVKCTDSTTKKQVSNGGADKLKTKAKGKNKFKVKFSFKKSIRKMKEKINLVFGTCLK